MDKIVLITGATSGIGLACARKFADNGDKLILYEGNLDDWETMIDTNIKGLLTMTRLIVPGMVERNSGHIINVGSVAGDAAYAGGNVYCATKAAVKGDEERAAKLYTGIKPLTGDDIADVAVYAANAPAHVQIAEVLILATHQASGSVIVRK